jgi:hypothetical protein
MRKIDPNSWDLDNFLNLIAANKVRKSLLQKGSVLLQTLVKSNERILCIFILLHHFNVVV